MPIEDILSKADVVGILVFIIVSGMKKVWVFGWIYIQTMHDLEEMRSERDEWKELAWNNSGLAERAITIVKTKAKIGK